MIPAEKERPDQALQAASGFDLPAPPLEAARHGGGHIHQTFLVRTRAGDFLLQRLNERVFPDLDAVMENLQRVAAHLSTSAPSPRHTLRLRRARSGDALLRTGDGAAWRMLDFIPGAVSHDVAPDLDHIRAAACAFGEFQRRLDSLPGPPLKDTLPGFHDTRRRFERFEQVLTADVRDRAATCREEAASLLARRALAPALQELRLPVRTVHNDTKLNNLLFDASTGEALCVIDWDTTMPGLAAHDFGDMARTMASDTAEDEPDTSRARLLPERLAAIREGYLSAVEGWLSPAETRTLDLGARTLLFEQALRFLTDHLEGDVYYPVSRPDHNLIRARVQLALLDSLESLAV